MRTSIAAIRITASRLGAVAIVAVAAIVAVLAVAPLLAATTQPLPGEADYAAAVKAAASQDCPTALDRFEAALRTDADNLRYGSDYRRAVIACAAYDRAIDFFTKLT